MTTISSDLDFPIDETPITLINGTFWEITIPFFIVRFSYFLSEMLDCLDGDREIPFMGPSSESITHTKLAVEKLKLGAQLIQLIEEFNQNAHKTTVKINNMMIKKIKNVYVDFVIIPITEAYKRFNITTYYTETIEKYAKGYDIVNWISKKYYNIILYNERYSKFMSYRPSYDKIDCAAYDIAVDHKFDDVVLWYLTHFPTLLDNNRFTGLPKSDNYICNYLYKKKRNLYGLLYNAFNYSNHVIYDSVISFVWSHPTMTNDTKKEYLHYLCKVGYFWIIKRLLQAPYNVPIDWIPVKYVSKINRATCILFDTRPIKVNHRKLSKVYICSQKKFYFKEDDIIYRYSYEELLDRPEPCKDTYIIYEKIYNPSKPLGEYDPIVYTKPVSFTQEMESKITQDTLDTLERDELFKYQGNVVFKRLKKFKNLDRMKTTKSKQHKRDKKSMKQTRGKKSKTFKLSYYDE